jgi:sulfotransferase
MMKLHFLAGLPRSGSTLLTKILNQNPNIFASTNSPLLDTIHYTEEYLLYRSEQVKSSEFFQQNAIHTLQQIPKNLYHNVNKPIIIDKSRGWTNQITHIQDYITKTPKIICTVRNITDILVSFLSLIERSSTVSFIDESLNNLNLEITNENRCDFLMSPAGIIGQSYHSLTEAFRKGYEDYLLLIEYENLVSNTQRELNRIHRFLEIEEYSYDFENIDDTFPEKDEVYGLTGMHSVRPKVSKIYRDHTKYMNDYILNKYSDLEFWKKPVHRYSVFGV